MKEYIMPFIYLLEEMAPYLLLGFFIAGLLHAFVPQHLYRKWLGGNDVKSVLLSILFGIPLPLCSCGVIPTAVSMRKEGASKGAVTSFLIATPQTGVDSIAATWSVFGPAFAILRPLVAMVTGFFGGIAANVSARREEGDSAPVGAAEVPSRPADAPKRSFGAKMAEALRYGFGDMIEDIGRWLVIGLVLAGLITIFVPDDFFTTYASSPLLNMLMVLLIAVPMYVCATGSIPIAAALMLKGLSPGAALVFLMAGPATNIASMLILGKTLGRKSLLIYLASIIIGAIGFGLLTDALLPAEWFTSHLSQTFHSSCCHDEASATPWWQIASTILLVLLLIRALVSRLCGGGHHHDHDIHETESKMKTYNVKGMACNHCKANVERAVSAVEGVSSVTVDLASGTASVEGDADPAAVVKAVEAAGYNCTEA